MRLLKILILLLGSILFFFSNVYAKNFLGGQDEYSIGSHLKNRILVQVQGGTEIQPTGILKYFEELKLDPNTEIGTKDFFEMASNNPSLSFEKKELYGYVNPAVNSIIRSSPSSIKFNDSYGPNGLIDGLNHDLINIPNKIMSPGDGFHFSDKVQEYLTDRLSSLRIKDGLGLKTNLICNPELILNFYLNRKMMPVWMTKDGLSNEAEIFIKTIIKADQEGLDSSIYHRDDIMTVLKEIELYGVLDAFEPKKYTQLELFLTDAFFSYGFHLSEGIVEPNPNDFEWHINKPKKNLLHYLKTSLQSRKLDELVDMLQPHHSGYLRLKSALLKYKDIKNSGGWPRVSAGSKLRRGDTGKRIAALRKRLIITGDLKDSKNGDESYFDDALEDSVKKFQARNGLKDDGVVGSDTLSALNVSVDDRIETIKLNMERWRWLPRDLGERYILVNTTNFELNIIENGQMVASTRVIVGKKKRPTPALSRKITYMELNPYWNIPHKIAINDMLPSIKKDSNFLKDKNIRVFENWEEGAKELSPESIDWDTVTKENFAYKLRQDPTNSNALGHIKFIFPNEFSIYLHDTPARELFNKTKRTFSSGCIRIEKPMELASYLLADNSRWTHAKLTAAINSKKTRTIFLSDPMNIHILYWTAWIDKDGVVNFRDDIYGWDRQLNIALKENIHSPEIKYEGKPEKKILSFRTFLESNLPIEDISNIGSWLLTDTSSR